jgi:replication factor A1
VFIYKKEKAFLACSLSVKSIDLPFEMATAAAEKRKPVFIKVEELKPGTNGHNLTVKILDSKPVPVPKPRRAPMSLSQHPQRPSRINECLVGDETGCVVFTARNEQGNRFVHLYG